MATINEGVVPDALEELVHRSCDTAFENGYAEILHWPPRVLAMDTLDFDSDVYEHARVLVQTDNSEQMIEIVALHVASWQEAQRAKDLEPGAGQRSGSTVE